MLNKMFVKFTKMHGAGNDFIVLETDDTQCDWSTVSKTMCDRRFGIGADGLLLLLPSKTADFQIRMFNPDGSESDTCGNGLRCLVKYSVDHEIVKPDVRSITVETGAGIRNAEFSKVSGKLIKIKVNMDEPKFKKDDIPMIIEQEEYVVDIKSMISYPLVIDGKELMLNLVSMGNPHAVYFCEEPVNEFPLSEMGPQVEHHKIFPQGVNFEIVRVIGKQNVEARVWERGAGETLACGSGACAIAVASQLHGYIDKKVEVKLPGGILEVEWDGAGDIFLSGPTETVFVGEWVV
ncbi:diaminopimelate epimerase [Chloroflexota bacterium]